MHGPRYYTCPGCEAKAAAIATLTAERDALQAATRKVVEAVRGERDHWSSCDECEDMDTPCEEFIRLCGVTTTTLSNPTIVALRREL
jgi:hypothetical protein